MASGDRRREWPIRDRIQEAETEPLPANAAEPWAFRALIHNWLERPDWLADDAVRCQPVSKPNSLRTRK